MIQKVAIYIRVSTLDQARNGYSLAAQRKTLEDYATLHGYEVVHVYADEGISGKDISHRPAVREMLEEIKEGGIDIILVWALSRLAELCRLKGYTGKRGRTFRAEHIKTILTRPIYIGYNSYCGQLFQGSHPPIIDNPTWDRVQRLIKQPKRIGRPNKKEET